ncbi:MAG: rRNA pseudouridine synthase [Deltaproteobacteria bacterium]|nr:rRNA pseudouridine synthase [Deltaproteobacteria bacterium]
MAERIQKILSQAGIASRREAEKLILQGQVRVNGLLVKDLGFKVDLSKDQLVVRGKKILLPSSKLYFAYYKPRGVIVSKKDEWGRKAWADLLKLPKEVNAVGRLDKDSEGLLLLTSDGALLQQLTHPRYEVPKVYRVQVTPGPRQALQQALEQGVSLDGKPCRALEVKIGILGKPDWIELTLLEGRNREIRRMLELFDYQVKRLIRIKHGKIALGNMEPGELKTLTQEQVKQLKGK